MLALVVGGSAPVPAPVLDRDAPRRATAAPLGFVARDDVAVPIREHRGQRRIFEALGEQHRRRAGDRIGPDRAVESEPGEIRRDLSRQVAQQVGAGIRPLAFGAHGHARLERREQRAGVHPARGVRERCGTRLIELVHRDSRDCKWLHISGSLPGTAPASIWTTPGRRRILPLRSARCDLRSPDCAVCALRGEGGSARRDGPARTPSLFHQLSVTSFSDPLRLLPTEYFPTEFS